MKSKIMPPLVLTVICIVVCGLLVIAHNASHADKTGVVTPEMKKGCEEIFGKGDYSMLMKQVSVRSKSIWLERIRQGRWSFFRISAVAG